MLKVSINLLALALVAISSVSNASDAAADVTAGKSFGCEYEVHNNSAIGGSTARFGPEKDSNTANAAQCLELCDKDAKCLYALYTPDIPGPCQRFDYLSYVRDPIVRSKGSTLIRVVPNSCDKRAAILVPHTCTQRTATLENGCQFQVKCNTSINHISRTAGFIALNETPRDCAERATKFKGDDKAVAFEWHKGGRCEIVERRTTSVFEVPTKHEENTETWQLVRGSCAS